MQICIHDKRSPCKKLYKSRGYLEKNTSQTDREADRWTDELDWFHKTRDLIMLFKNSRIVSHIERINTRKEYKGIQPSSVFREFKKKKKKKNPYQIHVR